MQPLGLGVHPFPDLAESLHQVEKGHLEVGFTIIVQIGGGAAPGPERILVQPFLGQALGRLPETLVFFQLAVEQFLRVLLVALLLR